MLTCVYSLLNYTSFKRYGDFLIGVGRYIFINFININPLSEKLYINLTTKWLIYLTDYMSCSATKALRGIVFSIYVLQFPFNFFIRLNFPLTIFLFFVAFKIFFSWLHKTPPVILSHISFKNQIHYSVDRSSNMFFFFFY